MLGAPPIGIGIFSFCFSSFLRLLESSLSHSKIFSTLTGPSESKLISFGPYQSTNSLVKLIWHTCAYLTLSFNFFCPLLLDLCNCIIYCCHDWRARMRWQMLHRYICIISVIVLIPKYRWDPNAIFIYDFAQFHSTVCWIFPWFC